MKLTLGYLLPSSIAPTARQLFVAQVYGSGDVIGKSFHSTAKRRGPAEKMTSGLLQTWFPWVESPMISNGPMIGAASPRLATEVTRAGGLGEQGILKRHRDSENGL